VLQRFLPRFDAPNVRTASVERKRYRSGMQVVSAVLLAACATSAPPIPPKAAPPPLYAQLEASRDLDGTVVGPSDAQATVVIVMASWCGHCRDELAVFDAVRAAHPAVRWLAVNYKAHEEYDRRGNSIEIRALARQTPWLRVIPADETLFASLGRPPLIPTVFVFDRDGSLVARFDRRERKPPDPAELDALLVRIE
jgi:thiol-disulfide isomerase/thioredoxin